VTMFQNLARMMGGAETLKMRCERCDHAVTWTRDEAFRWLGPDATPMEVRRRLVCRLCRGPAQVWI
jgi:hypothetical protein